MSKDKSKNRPPRTNKNKLLPVTELPPTSPKPCPSALVVELLMHFPLVMRKRHTDRRISFLRDGNGGKEEPPAQFQILMCRAELPERRESW